MIKFIKQRLCKILCWNIGYYDKTYFLVVSKSNVSIKLEQNIKNKITDNYIIEYY